MLVIFTRRSDSDIVMPYGYIRPKTPADAEDDEKKMDTAARGNSSWQYAKKTGFAAWFVSNCQTVSRRENLVAELKSYLPPDSIHVGPFNNL
jgi:hypothetical protein